MTDAGLPQTDETLQKRIAELEAENTALKNDLHQIRGLVDAPRNIMLFSFDPEYRYISYNQAHYEFVKHNWGIIIHKGMNVLDIFVDEKERQSARDHFDKVLQGESYLLKRKYKKRKGETIFYENTYIPVIEDGVITAATVFAHDITQWSEQKEEWQKFRSIFDKALEGIFRSTVQGRFIEANREMARILGYDSPEELMQSVTDISSQLYCDPEARDTVFNILREEAVVKDFHTRMYKKDRTPIWVEFNARCERNKKGKTVFVEGKLTDITARKEAEKQAEARRQQLIQSEKMASLGVLVAGVAHEINNPNSYLTLNLPLLKDVWNGAQSILDEYSEDNGDFVLGGLEYSELRDHLPYLLNEMIEGAARIKDIVSRLKDYSRQNPEDGREYVELSEVIKGALTFVRHRIKSSGARFELIMPEKAPYLEVNPQRLIQVLINLIINGCEALPQENGQLTVTLDTKFNPTQNISYARISVEDNGCGIPAENLKLIEDPFFTTKRDTGGTGLGLSISSSIMRDHDGALDFTSSPDGGTKATMLIPIAS
ncbi:MAG: ATP-binding protein [Desulfovibrio sp.]